MNEIKVIKHATLLKENFQFDLDEYSLLSFFTQAREERLLFKEGSLFLYVQSGNIFFKKEDSSFNLGHGHYFSIQSPISLEISPESLILIIHVKKNFKALNNIGGPVEEFGRLKYIDGCSDTLLIPPPLMGDPCLNLLHFPQKTIQTMHNHPSFRFGIVTRGNGKSVSEHGEENLESGDLFLIPAFVNHKFNTENSIMDVIAFHPDSDWGPTDEVHPMINRTWVGGKKI